MPTPMEDRLASQDVDRFPADVAAETDLGSRYQACTTTQAAFLCFRRGLTLQEAIGAGPSRSDEGLARQRLERKRAFILVLKQDVLTAQVRQLRVDHNFSPDTALGDFARAPRAPSGRRIDRKK